MPAYDSGDNQPLARCPKCHGTGKVTVGKDDLAREVDCSLCNGYGRVSLAQQTRYLNSQRNKTDSSAGNDSATGSPASNSKESPTQPLDLDSSSSDTDEEGEEAEEGEEPTPLRDDIPPGWTEEEYEALLKEADVPCPRCGGMKIVMDKGKRGLCYVCKGFGKVSQSTANDWRKSMKGVDGDRFNPRS